MRYATVEVEDSAENDSIYDQQGAANIVEKRAPTVGNK